jgi:hypothetical protein
MTHATEVEPLTLDDLLCRWHQWQTDRHRHGRGWPSRAVVCGDSMTSRQYDDANGALDAAIDHSQMRVVEFEVSQLADSPVAYRSAIYANARALVTGAAVWSSPRLPGDRIARQAVVTEARDMLTVRLRSAGLM